MKKYEIINKLVEGRWNDKEVIELNDITEIRHNTISFFES
jgi:hypothetical protein